MNELAVRVAIKQLIEDSENELVQGLTMQTLPRTIHQVTYSQLTPPSGYYFLNVIVSNSSTGNRSGTGRTVSLPASEATYTVYIDISDYAVAQYGEDQLFESMDAQFQLFTDRLVSKLRETYWLPSSNGLSFRLDNDRTVTKTNFNTSWEEAAQYHALLYSRINLTVLEECTDDNSLY
jgi:hypothetical protein